MDREDVAADLRRKIRSLFPEFQPFLLEGDEENPTITLTELVASLQRAGAATENTDLLARLRQFQDWVEEYPRGEDVNDDLLTWYMVSFVEQILEHDTLFRFGPAIISEKSLIASKEYFYTWIGPTAYHRALSAFAENDKKI
jgi:hypothetical protein